jgi:peptide/nickel transport system substrate-binding protein
LTLGFAKLTWSIIPNTFDFYWQPPAYPHDRSRARQLLTEAGYPNGFDAGDYFCDAAWTNLAEAVINDLQTVGLRLKLRPLERATFYKGLADKKLRNVAQTGSAAFGNAATRLETFAVSGGEDVKLKAR